MQLSRLQEQRGSLAASSVETGALGWSGVAVLVDHEALVSDSRRPQDVVLDRRKKRSGVRGGTSQGVDGAQGRQGGVALHGLRRRRREETVLVAAVTDGRLGVDRRRGTRSAIDR